MIRTVHRPNAHGRPASTAFPSPFSRDAPPSSTRRSGAGSRRHRVLTADPETPAECHRSRTACYTAKMPRTLRITASIFFGLLTAALIVLWIRSYWRADSLQGNLTANRALIVRSIRGGVPIAIIPARVPPKLTTKDSIGLSPRGGYRPSNLKYSPDCDESLHFAFRLSWPSNGSLSLLAPHWAFILCAGALASALWLIGPLHFSLRTLLITTTLLAFMLGLAVWLASPA